MLKTKVGDINTMFEIFFLSKKSRYFKLNREKPLNDLKNCHFVLPDYNQNGGAKLDVLCGLYKKMNFF